MLCNLCGVKMIPETRYELKNGKCSPKGFDECPKCHFRKYKTSSNVKEKVE